MSNKILEEAGVIGDVNVFEFPLYFLPLDQDLLSLELEDSFSDLFLVSLNIKPPSLDSPPSDLFE